MKAIWLRQPWATLVAIGVKEWETRSAPPNGPMRPDGIRGMPGLAIEPGERIAIVASKGEQSLAGRYGELSVDWTDDGQYGLTNYAHSNSDRSVWHSLPLGVVVCTAIVAEALPIVDPAEIQLDDMGCPIVPDGHRNMIALEAGDLTIYGDGCDFWLGGWISDQLPYGDWTPGRWAWRLTDVEPVTGRHEPVVTRGSRQGVCEIEETWT